MAYIGRAAPHDEAKHHLRRAFSTTEGVIHDSLYKRYFKTLQENLPPSFYFTRFAANLTPVMAPQNWEKYLKFRCTGCGNCCRDTVVCITDADVQRIIDGTGKSPLDFVRFYTHDEIAMSENDPLWVKLTDQKAVMGLRSLHDHCIFLDDETNLCTIYEHRPVTCRDHPFNVTFSDTGAVEKISLSKIVKCPHDWDGDVSRRELRRVQTWNERQEESYLKKIRVWNRQTNRLKTRPAFLRFLGFSV